jgi:LPS sulfotransferase NodH
MQRRISYTIWFSQRTGSTLLSKALETTGIAGQLGEWLISGADLLHKFHLTNRERGRHLLCASRPIT